MTNKKVFVEQILAGPGVMIYTTETPSYQYINNENVELITRVTNVSLDHNYIATQLAIPGNPLYHQIQHFILDAIKDNLNIKVVPWSKDDVSFEVRMGDQVLINKDSNARED